MQVMRCNDSQRVHMTTQQHIANALIRRSVDSKSQQQQLVGVRAQMNQEGAEELVLHLQKLGGGR